MTNIVTAVFGASRVVKTRALYQWDYGQVLQFEGLDLPDAYTVHFSNQGIQGTAKTQVGNADGVSIPDEYLTTGLTVYAWVYLHAGEDDGETTYAVIIPVTARPQPTEEEPTPVQQGVINQAIAALNAGVEAAQEAAESVQDMGVEVETLAPGSEATVEKTVDPDTGAVTLAFGIPTGPRGETGKTGPAGADGSDGADGVSPTVTVTDISGGHRVTITDADGTQTFDVMDGAEGQTGPAGADGYSPSASVSKSGSTATITITDKSGTTTAQISDGQNGQNGTNGTNGVSPSVAVTSITGGHQVAITDAQGTETFNVMDGADGASGAMIVETVSGTTPTITAADNHRYVCGEVSTLDITVPASGIIDVVFQSGATATMLTITPPTGVTLKWANGFDPTALEANTTYEINVADGLGVAESWT